MEKRLSDGANQITKDKPWCLKKMKRRISVVKFQAME